MICPLHSERKENRTQITIMYISHFKIIVFMKVLLQTLSTQCESPDEDDDVGHCSCFVLCDDEDCVLVSVMKC